MGQNNLYNLTMILPNFKDFVATVKPSGRLMGIDWGAKRTGLAISDESRDFVFPRGAISGNDPIPEIMSTIASERIVGIVIGLPLWISGAESETTAAVRAFAARLVDDTDTPIVFMDESLTSVEASGLTRNRLKLDSAAAAVILENAIAMMKRVNTDTERILEFYKVRMRAHADSVHYFGTLLGFDFNNHDDDKFQTPIAVPYAFKIWQEYHPEYVRTDEMEKQLWAAHSRHHTTADHHAEFYQKLSDIPYAKLMEMVCDWYAANMEARFMAKVSTLKFPTVMDFYISKKKEWKFTKQQDQAILRAIEKIESELSMDGFLKRWSKLEVLR